MLQYIRHLHILYSSQTFYSFRYLISWRLYQTSCGSFLYTSNCILHFYFNTPLTCKYLSTVSEAARLQNQANCRVVSQVPTVANWQFAEEVVTNSTANKFSLFKLARSDGAFMGLMPTFSSWVKLALAEKSAEAALDDFQLDIGVRYRFIYGV